ncbi:MAG: hypothetical protein V1792_13300, partial [Pseudomonadota bacterium]
MFRLKNTGKEAGATKIPARRPGLRRTQTKPVILVGRASRPVVFVVDRHDGPVRTDDESLSRKGL